MFLSDYFTNFKLIFYILLCPQTYCYCRNSHQDGD